MATIKKTLDESGLLYFGKEYYKKLQGKFVALEEGKALSTNDFTTAEKEKLAGIEANADVNVLETVKVNGSALTPNSNKEVDITVVEGTDNGTIKVNDVAVNVHGLKSAAFTESSAYDEAGAAAAVLGASTDTSSANTVFGVKKALTEALGDGGNVSSQISDAIAELDGNVSANASGTPAKNGVMVLSGVAVAEVDGVLTSATPTSVEVEVAGAAAQALQDARDYADGLAPNYDAAGAAANVLGTSEDASTANTVFGVKKALLEALGDGGNVSSQIQTAVNALDKTDAAVENQFVTSVSEEDGIITVTRAQPSAANISVAALDGIAAGDLQTVLGALEDAIDAGGTGSVVTITEAAGSGDVLKVYTIKQGTNTVGTINIPKDFLVKSGSVREATASDTGYEVGEKLLDFVVNSVDGEGSESHILISVAELVDAYTAGNGIEVSSSNVISAVIDGTSESFLTVGASGLKLSGVQTAINTAEANAKTYTDNKVAALDADLDASGSATDATNGVFVVSGVTEVDGVLTAVDSVEVDKAGAAAAAEAAAKSFTTAEIGKLDADLDASGTAANGGVFVVSGVTEVDGVLTAVDSVEVDRAGAAAAAETAAKAYTDTEVADALEEAKGYADQKATDLSVSAAVAQGSADYVTASASGKTVTVGLTADAIASLGLANSAIQSLNKVDGNYVLLTISADGTARTITVNDSAIDTALAAKAGKPNNAVNGNLAALDANGNILDSGVNAADLTTEYMTNQEIDTLVSNIFTPSTGA